MRCFVDLCIVAAAACAVTSCASMMIGDARAYGRLHDVSDADIHAAIDADRVHTTKKIYEIEVVSSDEIHVYHEPRSVPHAWYDIVRRVRGHWRFIVAPVIVG